MQKMDSDFLTHRMEGILKYNENCFYSWAVSCNIPKMFCILSDNQEKKLYFSELLLDIYTIFKGIIIDFTAQIQL